jgi:hypothetical protein
VTPAANAAPGVRERIERLDWKRLAADLDANGFARTPPLLDAGECSALVALYADDRHFRKRVEMERHRFGVGDYAYFASPLPPLVRELRTHCYPRLAPVANEWAERTGRPERFPRTLAAFLRGCHANGQTRPTPLLLRYAAGGYNRLHQDLYGEVAFPLQATLFLSRPGVDYTGGEFLLVEQPPRQQAIARAIRPEQGEMVLFPSAVRPVRGAGGWLRVAVRHGVSPLESGGRFALGIIFHDAR